MGYKIFTHEIHSSYAARVENYRSYDTISKDIIQRWTYPLVPDVQFSGNCVTKPERQGTYRASGERTGICRVHLMLVVICIYACIYLYMCCSLYGFLCDLCN